MLEAGYPAHLITGIDYSQASVDLCKAISEEHGVEGVRWLRADIIDEQDAMKLKQECTKGKGWHLVTDKGVGRDLRHLMTLLTMLFDRP